MTSNSSGILLAACSAAALMPRVSAANISEISGVAAAAARSAAAAMPKVRINLSEAKHDIPMISVRRPRTQRRK